MARPTDNNTNATDDMIARENNARVTGSGLGNAVSQIKSVQVALEARLKQGDKLVDFLKQKLETNLKAQLTDNLTLRRQAVREMKVIRDELYRENTSVSQKTRDTYVGLYNRAIEESVKSNSILAQTASDFAESVKGNLPSMNSILAAVSVANPVVGFGLKLTKDLISSAVNRKRAFEDERRRNIKNLEDEAGKIEKEDEAAQAVLNNQNEVKRERDRSRSETQKEWLKRIHGLMEQVKNNTQRLIEMDGSDGSGISYFKASNDGGQQRIASPLSSRTDDDAEKIVDSQQNLRDELVSIKDNTHDMLEYQKVSADLLEKQRLERIEQSRESGGNSLDAVLASSSTKKADKGGAGFSLLGGLFGGGKGLLGMIGNVGKMVLAPLGGLFTRMIGLARFIPGAAVIAAAIGGSISFFNGFNNAAEILGKPENQIDFGDRVAAGIGNLAGSIGGMIDWTAGLFGKDLNLQESLTKDVSKFTADLFDSAQLYVTDAFEMIDNFLGDARGTIEQAIEWGKKEGGNISDFFSSLFGINDEEQQAREAEVQAMLEETRKRIEEMDKMQKEGASPEQLKAYYESALTAPTINNVNNSSTTQQTVNVPENSRNDDRTITRIHRMSTGGAH